MPPIRQKLGEKIKSMAYIYRHIRLDKNEPFYIGMGEDLPQEEYKYRRAYVKSSRSRYWKNVANKTSYEIEILEDDLTWEEAKRKEIWWISFYGRRDLGKGPLVNRTDGGDEVWCKGTKFSEEYKKKLSDSHKGQKAWNKGIPLTPERNKKLHSYNKGKKLSDEQKKKLSEANLRYWQNKRIANAKY